MSRIIHIPDTLSITGLPTGPTEFPFSMFIEAILNMSEWGTDWKAIQAATEVHTLTKYKPGDSVTMHQTTYDRLKTALESPKSGYGLTAGALRQMIPYFEAILEAPKTPTEG